MGRIVAAFLAVCAELEETAAADDDVSAAVTGTAVGGAAVGPTESKDDLDAFAAEGSRAPDKNNADAICGIFAALTDDMEEGGADNDDDGASLTSSGSDDDDDDISCRRSELPRPADNSRVR